MKKSGIRAEHSVPIQTEVVAAAIKRIHGKEPMLVCERYYEETPRSNRVPVPVSRRSFKANILSVVYLCFNRLRAAVDCPREFDG